MFKKIIIGILILVVLAIGFVNWQAYKINNKTGEFSYETLSAEPIGTESYVSMADGTKIRAVVAGEGSTVVLAHGFGGAIREWNLVFNQFPLIANGWLNTIVDIKPLATLFAGSLVGDPNEAITHSMIDGFRLQNYPKLIPILQAFVDENYYDRLPEIPVSGTILIGTADKTTPAFHAENLAKGIKNARLVKIEGKGHILNWEAPQQVCEEIEKLAK